MITSSHVHTEEAMPSDTTNSKIDLKTAEETVYT